MGAKVPQPEPVVPGAPGDLKANSAASDRWNRGAWIFRDETLRKLEFLLDEAFRIPGTPIRFGLDAVVGLVPGFGDVLAGLFSLIIPLAAWIRGVPYITLMRMAANLGIGVLVGSIPILGDAFDIAWKVNRRNYRLLTVIWANLGATPGATGLFSCRLPPFSDCLCHPGGRGPVAGHVGLASMTGLVRP